MLAFAKDRLRSILKKRNVHLMRGLPRGVSATYDIANTVDIASVKTIFDVGANVGQTTAEYLREFPFATIFAFEPSEQLFRRLSEAHGETPRVRCEQLAFGSSNRTDVLIQTSDQTMFHIGEMGKIRLDQPETGREEVRVTTLDSYCERHSAGPIDLLKVDTEGHDLEVLRGALGLLRSFQIRFVQCECGISPDNRFHVPFELVKPFMEEQGYRLFGIYDQVNEWTLGKPYLRRINALFLSPAVT